VCVRFSGPVSGPELRGLIDWQVQVTAGNRAYYVLGDLTAVGAVSTEARRIMNEGRGNESVRAFHVCFGASFGSRIVMDMVTRAMRLLNPELADAQGDVIFVEDEAEARARIAAHRGSRASITDL